MNDLYSGYDDVNNSQILTNGESPQPRSGRRHTTASKYDLLSKGLSVKANKKKTKAKHYNEFDVTEFIKEKYDKLGNEIR